MHASFIDNEEKIAGSFIYLTKNSSFNQLSFFKSTKVFKKTEEP